MSQPDFEASPVASAPMPQAHVPTQKQQLNVYTMMLIISFIALCVGCGLLYWELSQYGNYPQWSTRSVGASTLQAVDQISQAIGWIGIM